MAGLTVAGDDMLFYSIIVLGRGIQIKSSPEDLIGFATTRRVQSFSSSGAIAKAKKDIFQDWASGELHQSNTGYMPTLEVHSIRRVGIVEHFFSSRPASGYTFFSREN